MGGQPATPGAASADRGGGAGRRGAPGRRRQLRPAAHHPAGGRRDRRGAAGRACSSRLLVGRSVARSYAAAAQPGAADRTDRAAGRPGPAAYGHRRGAGHRGRAGGGPVARRDRRGGRGVRRGAPQRGHRRRRAGADAAQRQRDVRQPGPPQPGAGGAPAELLDELEREESDPDQLENLFKLDHLAARMRRNDESLLVLAGTDSTRRWNRPVGLGAVLLAAAAEIEQYQRIRHESAAEVHVSGTPSPSWCTCWPSCWRTPPRSPARTPSCVVTARVEGGGALIEIVDQGLGMSPTALAEANAVLATPPAADVAAVGADGPVRRQPPGRPARRPGAAATGGQEGLVARAARGAGRACWRRRTRGAAGPAPRRPAMLQAPRWPGRPGPARAPMAARPASALGLPVAGRSRPAPCPARPARYRCAPRRCWPAAAADAGGGWWSRQVRPGRRRRGRRRRRRHR